MKKIPIKELSKAQLIKLVYKQNSQLRHEKQQEQLIAAVIAGYTVLGGCKEILKIAKLDADTILRLETIMRPLDNLINKTKENK